MTKLTNVQMEMLEKEAKEVVKQISEGKSTKEILSEIYVNGLENKTKDQGDLMADATIKAVAEFDEAMEQATNDREAFADNFIAKMDEGKTPVERCTYWLRFTSALLAVSCGDEAEKAEHLRNAEVLTVTDKDATPELEQELKANAKEALLNNTILLENLENLDVCLEQISEIDGSAKLITGLSGDKVDLRAVMSMIFYVKVMNGEIEDAPEDITVEQISAAVCAGSKEVEVLEKLSLGEIAKDVAVLLLGTVSMVFIAFCMSKLALLFIGNLAGIFTGTILFLPAFIILSIVTFYFLFKHGGTLLNLGYEFAEIAVDVLSSAIKFIGKVVAKVVTTSFKVLAFVGKKTFSLVSRLFNRGQAQQTTTVTA